MIYIYIYILTINVCYTHALGESDDKEGPSPHIVVQYLDQVHASLRNKAKKKCHELSIDGKENRHKNNGTRLPKKHGKKMSWFIQ